jgi:hypothetical protein
MLLNIHIEESFKIRNKKFSSEWPFRLCQVEVVLGVGLMRSVIGSCQYQIILISDS